MAASTQTPWYLRSPKRWQHFRSMPFSRLRLLLLAVFSLFSTWAFYGDIMSGGSQPYAVVLANVVMSGLISALWIIILARFAYIWVPVLVVLSVINPFLMNWLDRFLLHTFRLHEVNGQSGIEFSATGTMIAIMVSYVLFVAFIRSVGREAVKLRNELDLAHGIQQTLVPPFTLRTARFEVYGISKPSERVGGDLVDAIELPNGDAIAYLGDIAGHGLQAGILMGMLKTATRTALLDAGERAPDCTMPVLLDRLNTVLPGVKEPQMYATFSGFRLCADGSVHFALAASTPVLHWHANGLAVSKMEEEQFPLGLLPVRGFDGRRLQMERDDLLVVATDGILEACDKGGEEFGVGRLEQAIATNAGVALPELAGRILGAAQTFGKQIDDQTILLIRCLQT
jgi:serine phosphatase RsbU (regulator of sigma subunit)